VFVSLEAYTGNRLKRTSSTGIQLRDNVCFTCATMFALLEANDWLLNINEQQLDAANGSKVTYTLMSARIER
jgi:hypothetical protein